MGDRIRAFIPSGVTHSYDQPSTTHTSYCLLPMCYRVPVQINNASQLLNAVFGLLGTAAFLHLSYPEEFARIVVQTSKALHRLDH